MGMFDNLFKSKEEKFRESILKTKPSMLMHTSVASPDKVSVLNPIYNKETNNNSVFATDSEKLAHLYALQPFFSFRFCDSKEIGVILLGSDHDLLNLDNKFAYKYYVDSKTFDPVIENEKLYYENEWISLVPVQINKNMTPKKICFNDVLNQGIQVFWVSDAETLKEIDKEMVDNGITNGDQKIEYLINQTNWRPDKVIHMNKFRNICSTIKTETGYVVDYSKKNS